MRNYAELACRKLGAVRIEQAGDEMCSSVICNRWITWGALGRSEREEGFKAVDDPAGRAPQAPLSPVLRCVILSVFLVLPVRYN